MVRGNGTAPAGGDAGRPRGVGALARDPVLLALVAAMVLATGWAFSGFGDRATRLLLLWALQTPLDLALCLFSLRVCFAPGITAAARRFWRALTVAAGCWAVGDLVQTCLVAFAPRLSPGVAAVIHSGAVLVGLVVVVAVMLRYPAGAYASRRRWPFYLDATAVLIAGAVLTWCFALDPTAGGMALVSVLLGTGIVLVAAFATVKMVLGGWAPMTTTAAAPMISAAFLQAIAVFASPTDLRADLPPAVLALRLLPSVLLVMGPRIQLLQANREPDSFAPRRPKPYSVLPYVAVTAAFGAMVATLTDELADRRIGAVAGTVAITALVVARQLVAFRENLRLIGRLDAALVDLREHEWQLRDQATTDALTGLANRRAFATQVAAALADDRRTELALLLIDLDNFKAVNDTLGHGVGDRVLCAVAGRLHGAVGAGDVVARVGGDEFGILLHAAPGRRAEQAAERVLARLSPSVSVGRHELLVRASIGLARATDPSGAELVDLESLLRHADIAMYAAKDRGKSGWAEYSPEMSARILETARLGAQLHDALADGQFRLRYQPIVELPAGQIVAVEALVRWHHPDRGVVSPADFIPVAEATGLIVPLGRWVLREACRQAAGWPGRAGDRAAISVSVNVAGRQLQEPRFAAEVAAALRDAGLAAHRLTIEVTETALLGDSGVVDTLHELRSLGVRLALDDFGTAASSLGLVLTCPMTSLKLDRSFVEDITTVARQEAVATAVAQMAQALRLTAVAEGIETPQQAKVLAGLGYRLAQGYLYARPLAADELVSGWLAAPPAPRLAN